MNFLEFYGLREDPFRLSPDPVYFYPSASHRVALDSLDYAVEQKEGFCLVSGEPGTGKTTLLKVFIDRWKERADIALILTPRLGPEEFLQALLEELNVREYGGSGKMRLIKAFRDFLLERSEDKRPVVIIVDEAQEIPDGTLEELRLLSNLETEKEKLLQIVLVGQPEMEKRLSTEALRQLDQRITVRARLAPLTAEEITAYINHRLIRAGKGFLRLDDRMVRLIHRFSRGIPRIINVITSRTIMSAYLEGHNVVTEKHVKYAIDHLDGGEFRPPHGVGRGFPAFYAAVAAVFFCAALAAGYFVFFGGEASVKAHAGPEAAVVEGTAQSPAPVIPVAARQ
ncbi:MAG: AAA family ATPase [Deltaproteobacteria bacterium]|nr:AAA family ATPase [Deltaproteobacteria bacterium]